MKTKNILLSLLLLLFVAGPLSAQKIYKIKPAKMQFAKAELKNPPAAEATALPSGMWYKSYETGYDDYILYKPAQKGRMQWGNYIDFAADGVAAKGYNAPCGNDSNIHRHTGKFSIEGEILTLDLGDEGTQRYRIAFMTAEGLALHKR